MKKNRPVLSISILISKKSDAVARCLKSLETIRKELTCELILVYTGTEHSQLLALEKEADCVIPFTWCDDFSKARNVGLGKASGEWFLYLDDDEWIENPEALIDFFQSGEYRRYGYANYIQRNYYDPNYANYTDSWVTRMVCLRTGVRFRSRIHEYFDPVYGEGKNLPMIANHSGYIYETMEDRKKRFQRNVPLLQAMMEEEPDNIRWGTQLAQECYAAEEWGMLTAVCRKELGRRCHQTNPANMHMYGTYYAGMVHGLIGLGRYREAKQVAEAVMDKKEYGKLFTSCMHLSIAEACYHLRQWEQAKENINRYFGERQAVLQDEKQYAIWQEALIVDQTYDMISQKKAYSIRIGSCLECRQLEAMGNEWRRLEWDQPTIYVFRPLLSTIVRTMLEGTFSDAMEPVWKCIWKNQKLYQATVEETSRFLQDEKQWEKMLESYRAFRMQILKKTFKPEIIKEFPELLPEAAQRAMKFSDEVTEQRGKMNVQGTINDFNAGMWQGYNYSVPGIHETAFESAKGRTDSNRYRLQRGVTYQTA